MHTKKRDTGTKTLFIKIGLSGVILLAVIFVVRMLTQKHAQAIPKIYGDVVADTFASKSTLRAKVTELESTVAAHNAELSELAVYKDENEKLKAELGRPIEKKGILATVITEPNRSFYDTFVIDAGSAEGIQEQQSVYAFGEVLLGVITKVNAHNATVTLLSQSGRQSTGTTVGSDVAVTLIGRGGGEYEVRIPRDVHFAIGDQIVAQSVQTSIIATIEKIVTDPRDPFQRLLAKAPVNLQALKWVAVR